MKKHKAAWGVVMLAGVATAGARDCDRACLEQIADAYRTAYLAHDPKKAPFAQRVRFTENNVEMEFPDASWDTVTEEIGPALTLVDPQTRNVGIYTTIRQKDTPGFIAVRLHVTSGRIDEVEHIVSTKRNVSGPPTPFGDVDTYKRDPRMARPVPADQRSSRQELIKLANGYFETLQNNTGEIRGTKFAPDATRHENGMRFDEIEKDFKRGYYRANNRVRDRDFFLVDEERGIVMTRGCIDHKGVLDEYTETNGKLVKSIFREPHTWSLLEAFKVEGDQIVAVEATFIGAPYYIRSPWTRKPDKR